MAAHLHLDSLTKRFPGVLALDGVSLEVQAGSIHALLGENGAGKSTLLKILSGVYRPDSGEIRVAGRLASFRRPEDAFRAGVAVIYQELHLVPEMTVAENLFLGRLPARFGILNRAALYRAAAAQLDALNEPIDPRARVGSLPIAQRQMLEIAKALLRDARIIAFDEPTSSLSAREVRKLFTVIRRLKEQGKSILYVSHRMEEIFELADQATVLRDGRQVQTFNTMAGVTQDLLVNRMVGREIADIFGYTTRSKGRNRLTVSNLWGPGLAKPVSLGVDAGEIVGLFGLVGAGRTELLKLIYGAVKPRAGSVTVDNQPTAFAHPRQALDAGMVFCPEDRKKEGVIGIRSVQENINLSARRAHSPGGMLINSGWEHDNAGRQVSQLRIKTPSLLQLVAHLSGGNQQKIVLGRLLSLPVKVILLDEPTRGIDVGAKSEIYGIIRQLADSGAAVLLVSSDLPEVLGIADRIMVMRGGEISGCLTRAEATPENCLKLALPPGGGPPHG